MSIKLHRLWIGLIGWLWLLSGIAAPLPLETVSSGQALGRATAYLFEQAEELRLSEAMAAAEAQRFTPGSAPILAFGIAPPPVWIHLPVQNHGSELIPRHLLIENAWVDQLDIYLVHAGKVVAERHLGDRYVHAARASSNRMFTVEHEFAPGITDIYIRAQTPDPLVLPLYLASDEDSRSRARFQDYSYGFLYGYLFALLAYNLVLYLSLRDQRHILYAAVLSTFLALNIAYTGHGFAMLWPNNTLLQQWIIPLLMLLYTIAGLSFGRCFVDTASQQPRLHRWLTQLIYALLALTLACILFFKDQRQLLLLAFACANLIAFLMPLIGWRALRKGPPAAHYFLCATLASAIGIALTSLCVWGWLPYTAWTFRAVELGMLIDATLLALALGHRFRAIQFERAAAEALAAHDPLTNLHNRRAFLELAQTQWHQALRYQRPMTLIMLDLDHFKSINDTHGHAAGDTALVMAAEVLRNTLRNGDLVARWGGEEFLILLPETGLDAALVLAERLRSAIAAVRLNSRGNPIVLTASLGVVERGQQASLDALLTEADDQLYRAKSAGRNCVRAAGRADTGLATA